MFVCRNNYIILFQAIEVEICGRGLQPKSLYKSHAGRHFYETENVIWAGFGPIGYTEKKSLGRI